MELYLDTAQVADVAALARGLPLAGVTTNPALVAACGQSVWDVLPRLQQALAHQGRFFAQVIGRDRETMVRQAYQLLARFPQLVVKIPVTGEGLAAIKQLSQAGISTLGTTVYSAAQGLLAALAGASYVAPYVNRVDAQGGDAIALVRDLQQLLQMHAPDCKVLAASFKTPRQVLDCLLTGCGAITLPPVIARQLLVLPAVDAALDQFDADWQAAFGTLAL